MADYPALPTAGEYPLETHEIPLIPERPLLKKQPTPDGDDEQPTVARVGVHYPGANTRASVRPEAVPFEFGVNKVWVQAGEERSRAFNDLKGSRQGVGVGGRDDLCFAPGSEEEQLEIGFEVHHPHNIGSAKLELYCKGSATPIWSKEWGGAWGGEEPGEIADLIPQEPTEDAVEGAPLAWKETVEVSKELKIDGELAFPDGLLTVARSPYQLRMSVTARAASEDPVAKDAMGGPLVAWTYLHVLVANVKIGWGDASYRGELDAGAKKPRVEAQQVLVTQTERALLAKLAEDCPHPGFDKDAPDRATPNALTKLHLPANLFIAGRETGNKEDFAFYQDLWRDGPRIPMTVTAQVKGADGQAVDCPKALVGARFLWDWEDPGLDDGVDSLKKASKDDAYVAAKRDYKPNDAGAPQGGSSNCHVRFGGKRGAGAAPIFPPQSGYAPADQLQPHLFPFAVEAAEQRTTAAVSRTWDAKALAGTSGVIFQPSRIAGDLFRVTVALDVDGALDSDDPPEPADALVARTGVFEVWKRLDVLYLRRGVAAFDVDDVKAAYAAVGIELEVTAKLLDEEAWKTAFAEAVEEWRKDNDRYSGILTPFLLRWGYHHSVDDDSDAADSTAIHTRPISKFFAAIKDAFQNGAFVRLKLRDKPAASRLDGREIEGQTSQARGIVCRFDAKRGYLFVLQVGDTAFGQEDVKAVDEPDRQAAVRESKAVTGWSDGARSDPLRDEEVRLLQEADDRVMDTLARQKAGEEVDLADLTQRQTDAKTRQLEIHGELDRVLQKRRGSNPELEREFEHTRRLMMTLIDSMGRPKPTRYLDGVEQGATCASALIAPMMRKYIDASPDAKDGETPKDLIGVFQFKRTTTTNRQLASGASDAALNRLSRGQVYLTTLDPDTDQMKGPAPVAAHEMGHALFLKHAPPEGTTDGEVKTHVEGEAGRRCLMNYVVDTDRFCGMCDLRLRGWNLELLDYEAKAQPEVEYKLELALGDVEELFSADASTDRGRMERLQLLGLFNRPLEHPEAADCLEVVWKHCHEQLFKNELAGKQGDARDTALEELLEAEVRKFVVQNGALPGPKEHAKIRLDGTYTNFYDHTLEEDMPFQQGSDRYEVEAIFLRDNPALGKIPLVATVMVKDIDAGDDAWAPAPDADVVFQLVKPTASPAFKAPERTPVPEGEEAPSSWKGQPKRSTEWEMVAGGRTYATQVTGTPLEARPKQYLKETVRDYEPSDGDDPQAKNVHFDLGGKRGMFDDGRVSGHRSWQTGEKLIQDDENPKGVTWLWGQGKWELTDEGPPATWEFRSGDREEYTLPNVLMTDPVDGFNEGFPHENRPPTGATFPLAEATDDVPYAVVCKTNAQGKAGVIFAPSSVGGDAYRVRAFVGPPTRDSDGTTADAGVKETGNLVRWRTIRLSRYLHHEATEQTLDGTVKTEMLTTYGRGEGAFGQGAIDRIDFEGEVTLEYAKAYCEWVMEPWAWAPEELGDAPGARDAFDAAVAFTQREQAMAHEVFGRGATNWMEAARSQKFPLDRRRAPNYDIANLIFWAPNSPYTFNFHPAEVYNQNKGPNFDEIRFMGGDANPDQKNPSDLWKWEIELLNRLLMDLFLPAFGRALGDNKGLLPGLVVIQGAKRWNYEDLYPNVGKAQLGKAKGPFAFIWGGGTHRKRTRHYDLAAHAMHEMGHCQFRLHAWPEPEKAKKHRVFGRDTHDAPGAFPNSCLMSYFEQEHDDHCGQCVAAFMGIRTNQRHFHAPKNHPAWESKVRFELVDAAGQPVAEEPYTIDLGDGQTETGVTDEQGRGECSVVPGEGDYAISFTERDATAWAAAEGDG